MIRSGLHGLSGPGVIGLTMMGGGAAPLGGAIITYLLLARFNAANQGFANGQVLDSEAEGVTVGQLTVTEVDGTLAIVANECAFTAQGTPVWTDLGMFSQAITRALGRGLFGIINLSTWEEMGMGWDGAAAVDDPDNLIHALQANTADGQIDVEGGTQVYAGLALNTDYRWCLVLGGYDVNETPYYTGQVAANYVYGCWYFVEVGGVWHLAWTSRIDNTATLYAIFTSFDAVGTLNDMLVPIADLSAVQEAITNFSSFTAPNGTSLDVITPEVGGGWTEQNGAWDIQGNYANPAAGGAIATVDSGVSDCIADGIVHVVTGAPDNDPGLVVRYSDNTHFWIVRLFDAGTGVSRVEIVENDAGFVTRVQSGLFATAYDTDYMLRAICDGQTIDGFVDGGTRISYGLAALNETETEHGIRNNATSQIFDNFAVYPRTAAAYETVLDAV